MLGFSEQDVLCTSEDWLERIHPDHLQNVTASVGAHLAGKTSRFQVEYQILTKQRSYVWMQLRGVAARDKNGKPIRIAGSQTDISERKAQEGKLFKAAFYDKLTNLPNRELFLDRLQQAAKKMQRLGARPAALLFLDLDRFKTINDTMGHEAGDALLINVAKRLKRCLRPGDTVSRLGGDEFTILLAEIEDEKHAHEIANRILEDISYPHIIYEQQIYVTASIGVVLINESGMKPETILRNADLAMYRAKTSEKQEQKCSKKNNSILL
jgi:diguanylate cyclase (GGDEF)-like protein/PAS domain S-box-containing protein